MANVLDSVTLKALAIELAAAMPPAPCNCGAEATDTADRTGAVRPVALVMHEAMGCLQAAGNLLENYSSGDESDERLARIKRASGLVAASMTVLRSLFGEGASHG